MLSVRTIVKFASAAAFAFVMIAVAFASSAKAQAMGEYGAAVGNAAVTTGAAAPAIAPDVGFKVSTQGSGNSGPTQTVEIREDDSEEAAPPRAHRYGKHAADSDDGGPDSDWTQVK